MSTATLARSSTFAVSNGFGFGLPKYFRRANGVLAFENVAVFRSGTFRDSSGSQGTWEPIHMRQMVDNWNHLRDSNIFTDVPVRDGHPGWLVHGLPGNGEVVGWHTALRVEETASPVDGEKYHYLFADYDITDPQAQEKILNGTWRNRSAEIRSFLTNAEAEHWPVYAGFAFVDIPAVEGLNFASQQGGDASAPSRFFVLLDGFKEHSVTTGNTQAQAGQAQAGLLGVQGIPQVFSVNGASVSDPVVVQAHITTLEAFRAETQAGHRTAFVQGLATAGKIGAPQIESLTAFALGLSPEQYAAWTKTYEAAPVSTVLAGHNAAVTNSTGESNNAGGSTQTPEEKELEIAASIVRQHQLASMPVAQIKAGASYKKLEAAGKAPAL